MSNYISIEERTFNFALRIVKACQFIEQQSATNRILSSQLLRSATSVGANVEESRAAQSTKDFIHKLEIALKEGRETRYWLRLIIDSEIISANKLKGVLNEIEEINKILAASIIKSKKKLK